MTDFLIKKYELLWNRRNGKSSS